MTTEAEYAAKRWIQMGKCLHQAVCCTPADAERTPAAVAVRNAFALYEEQTVELVAAGMEAKQ